MWLCFLSFPTSSSCYAPLNIASLLINPLHSKIPKSALTSSCWVQWPDRPWPIQAAQTQAREMVARPCLNYSQSSLLCQINTILNIPALFGFKRPSMPPSRKRPVISLWNFKNWRKLHRTYGAALCPPPQTDGIIVSFWWKWEGLST